MALTGSIILGHSQIVVLHCGRTSGHNQPGGIVGAVWHDFALLEQGEQFAQEEALSRQWAARPGNEHEERGKIAGDE